MATLQATAQPFSKPEMLAIAQTYRRLEAEYGVEHMQVRLKYANKAYEALIGKGFAKNLPESIDILNKKAA